MKLGLISDIHGDPLSLELAWAHLTVLGADRIVCAGDVVGYGPFPDRVIAFLGEHKIDSVRGNHDRWALGRGPGVADEFGGAAPSRATVEFLASLPFSLRVEGDGRSVVVVHGSPRGDMEYVKRSSHPAEVLEGLLDELEADVMVVGHTHAPMLYQTETRAVINPGSAISVPVVRTSRTFAILDLERLTTTFHDVESGRALEIPAW